MNMLRRLDAHFGTARKFESLVCGLAVGLMAVMFTLGFVSGCAFEWCEGAIYEPGADPNMMWTLVP